MIFNVKKTLLVAAMAMVSYSAMSNASYIDSLATVVYALKGEEQVKVLDILSEKHESVDSTMKFATMELELAQKLNMADKRANALRFLGWACCFRNDIEKAYEYILQANEIYTILADTLNQAHCCNMLGMILAMKGSGATADGFYNRSLELYKSLGRESAVAEIYRNMGHQCLEYKVYERAYEYFGRALDIDKRIGNHIGEAEDLYNLGYGQLLQCIDEDGSLTQLLRAKQILFESYGMLTDRRTTHYLRVCAALADVYLRQVKKCEKSERRSSLDSCQMYIDYGYSTIEQIGASGYKPTFDLRKACHELACGDYISSIKILNELESMIDESNLVAMTRNELYNTFVEYYEATGNYKMAYTYVKKINELVQEKNNDGYLVNSTQTKIQTEYDEEMHRRDVIFKQKSEKLTTVIVCSILMIAILSLLIIVIYRNSIRRRRDNELLNEQNKRLEIQQHEILEQNVLLNQKNEEIRIQRDEIEGQKNYLSSQNEIIKTANRQITDSLLYAQRIQQAAIPSDKMMRSFFGDCLVFWRPLNIVSGDFYWATQIKDYKFLAVADCTGHGVPGAFMSMLGISLLNDIVTAEDASQLTAAYVLDVLRANLKRALRQTGKKGEAEDGIDLAFCIFNAQSRQMQYAGAFRPLIIIRNDEMIEYKADKMPCGVYINESPNFTNNIVVLESGDVLYMYSDGISDQFSGGTDMRKFTIRRVKEMLMEIHNEPFERQKLLVAKTIDDWRRSPSKHEKMSAQVDDVLLVGLKIE